MKISSNQREMIIANLLKCVDGLHMTDVELIFDLAKSRAYENAKVILAPKIEQDTNSDTEIDFFDLMNSKC